MKALQTILQIPLLLLILFIGSTSAYEVLRAVQSSGMQHLDWRFGAHAVQGVLETAVLVWIYRRIGGKESRSVPQSDSAPA